MELSLGNDLDDVANLQATVLLALSKLSKRRRSGKKLRKSNGVSCKSIVEFLKANCSWIDGDIESQVMTALLSCIKTGLVCALVSGRYRLIGPSAKSMVTNCVLRPSHGPKCSCLNMLKCFSKSYGQICCFLERKDPGTKRKRLCQRKKNLALAKSTTFIKNKKRGPGCGKARINCIKAAKGFNAKDEDSNCLENRILPTKSLCKTCFPIGENKSLHYSNFSPGDGVCTGRRYLFRPRKKQVPAVPPPPPINKSST